MNYNEKTKYRKKKQSNHFYKKWFLLLLLDLVFSNMCQENSSIEPLFNGNQEDLINFSSGHSARTAATDI